MYSCFYIMIVFLFSTCVYVFVFLYNGSVLLFPHACMYSCFYIMVVFLFSTCVYVFVFLYNGSVPFFHMRVCIRVSI